MKKLLVVLCCLAAVFGACAYLLLGGALGRIVIPGPSHRIPDTIGRAYLRNDPSRSFAVNLDVLLPYMREADWTSDRWVLWKIPVVVELRTGQRLVIDRLNGQYTIDGIPGVFSNFHLSVEEIGKYGAKLNAALQEGSLSDSEMPSPSRPNKSLQPTATAVTLPAGAGSAPAVAVAEH